MLSKYKNLEANAWKRLLLLQHEYLLDFKSVEAINRTYILNINNQGVDTHTISINP